MKTVTLEVREPRAAMEDFARAWRGGKVQGSDRIVFPYAAVKVEFLLQAA